MKVLDETEHKGKLLRYLEIGTPFRTLSAPTGEVFVYVDNTSKETISFSCATGKRHHYSENTPVIAYPNAVLSLGEPEA